MKNNKEQKEKLIKLVKDVSDFMFGKLELTCDDMIEMHKVVYEESQKRIKEL